MGFILAVLGIIGGVFLVEELKKPSPTPAAPPPPSLPTKGDQPDAPVSSAPEKTAWSQPLSDYEVKFQQFLADAGGPQGMPYKAIFIQSHLETGGGTARALKEWNNGFGFHGDVGAPNKFWDGTHQTTTEGEVMRVYKSLDLSIGDYLRLIQKQYPACVMAAQTGDIKGYFKGLVQGGYATDPHYYDDLLARYKAIYGTNA